MALRKASSYSKFYTRPYTRKSKKAIKSYIKMVPNSKVTKYRMGDVRGFLKNEYPIVINILSKETCQIRDSAIEAARQYLNRFLEVKLGKEFYLEAKVFPHHIQRENKMITGAGADRMQTGMSQSFGKTMSRAALVKPNQTVFIVGIKNNKHEAIARKLISSIKARLPCGVATQTIYSKLPLKQS